MEIARIASTHLIHFPTTFDRPRSVVWNRNPPPRLRSSFNLKAATNRNEWRKCEAMASDFVATEQPEESAAAEEKFDWFAEWYPVMPVCDLDKRVPIAKKGMGLDLVMWRDRNENAWTIHGHKSCSNLRSSSSF